MLVECRPGPVVEVMSGVAQRLSAGEADAGLGGGGAGRPRVDLESEVGCLRRRIGVGERFEARQLQEPAGLLRLRRRDDMNV